MPDSFQYYNLPGGEMAFGTAPLLSQQAPALAGGSIVPPQAPTAPAASSGGFGSIVGQPVGRQAGQGGPSGGSAALGQSGAQALGQSAAAGNTAVHPSLASAAKLGLSIATGGADAPIDMLGGLAESAILKSLGIQTGDFLGGLLGSPFNVPGPALDPGALQAQISNAIALLGPNPTQVAVSTAISNTIAAARTAAGLAGGGSAGVDSGAANPTAGATPIGGPVAGAVQTSGGQLTLTGPAAYGSMAAAAGNQGGQGGAGNQGGGGGGGMSGGGSNAGAGAGGAHQGT